MSINPETLEDDSVEPSARQVGGALNPKRALILFLRYVIPGVATIFGAAALVYTSFFTSQSPEWLVYTPTQELGRPVTQQQKVPPLPWDAIGEGTISDVGRATCDAVSEKSPNAVACRTTDGVTIEPCYFVAGEVDPLHVYCFDPKPFQFFAYEVTSWTVADAVSDVPATPTWIYVRAPSRDNINDYSPKLVDLDSWKYDICTLDNRLVEEEKNQTYTCLTGATLSGGILGDRPHLFARYKDSETGETTSEWIGWIVYG